MKYLLVVIITFVGCADYHRYMISESTRSSTQEEHIEALQHEDQRIGLDEFKRVCVFYPKGYGAFSDGCHFEPLSECEAGCAGYS